MGEIELLEKAKECLEKAKKYYPDKDLEIFYLNACKGFMLKAQEVSMKT